MDSHLEKHWRWFASIDVVRGMFGVGLEFCWPDEEDEFYGIVLWIGFLVFSVGAVYE